MFYFFANVLETTLMYTIFVLSVYLLSGLTGFFSLGHGAFITIGAYTAGLATLRFGLPIWLAFILAIVMGLVGGLIIGVPTLKLRRDYFLLITFGFGEMVRALLLWTSQLTGGAMGMAGIPYAAELPLIAISVVVVLFIIANLKRSSFGRTCISIRDDELAAQAMGINVYAHKIKVFLLSAAIASYGGALLAFNMTFIEPNLFDWLESARLIVIIFVGGINSVTGALVTALFYYSFGELFRFANVWRDVILAVLVILVIIFRSQGLFGNFELSPKWIKSLFNRKKSPKRGA
ncbi:MAG: branched-chain amino acid ABC transporter permease [Sphaerochaetaceae bacterium]|jgi:branched-chain amino acid transport system permease protein|nr:branched-chain amino acid ABC transporter permease [Sphaerochaetaceae bacterium]MDD4260433.1 branched-chain amino acid ABC transporter permease [Sphaerochaetaceae bacterium]MDD4842178.1 branched-chain amino acid ABC transporter permease [Sphaerochaetaceae bacterium]MDD5076962.1 branched-chain amino acid ABC transporter permease [Sphaerochaetaceae bacterium]MDX9933432.1 branched-chain amino acid ABC transporter permease [Sphaerochaetaceae bacterium]